MKRVLVISNHHFDTYNFRKEVLKALLAKGYEVSIIVPYGDAVASLEAMGCACICLPLDKRGMNPWADLKLVMGYWRIIRKVKPDVMLSYTIKPNLYGGFLCRIMGIPYMANITGLGTAFDKEGLFFKLLIGMYRVAFGKIDRVFFQNTANRDLFDRYGIARGKDRLIPGSGINTQEFLPVPYPEGPVTEFLFVSRILKEKGIEQYLAAARHIRRQYPATCFRILGRCDEDYMPMIQTYEADGSVIYHGVQKNVKDFYAKAHCTVHPSYYKEGISNVLLESAATARPVITTNQSGCKEVVDDGVSGYLVTPASTESLKEALERFMALDREARVAMGLKGRAKVEMDFDRNIVVKAYMEEVAAIFDRKKVKG